MDTKGFLGPQLLTISLFDGYASVLNELPHWLGRIRGSELYGAAIENLPHFLCPRKWLYYLPDSGNFSHKRSFILVVEDMDLEPYEINAELWHTHMTEEILNDLFMVINELRLHDISAANLSFTKEGKLAFVDTKFYLGQMRLWVPRQFLSPEDQDYWDDLCENGLPPGWRSDS